MNGILPRGAVDRRGALQHWKTSAARPYKEHARSMPPDERVLQSWRSVFFSFCTKMPKVVVLAHTRL